MTQVMEWLRQIESKLDEWGRPAWIAAIVVGFIMAWPLGLALLVYTIWSGRMRGFGNGWKRCGQGRHRRQRWSTGNAAFDDYRAETMRRLEDEQEAFVSFLDKLRKAKDRAEFEQFMDERRAGNGDADMGPSAQPAT
ncbi:MAG: DUF2852 domain-containing protein [Pseudomonadota bacterium]